MSQNLAVSAATPVGPVNFSVTCTNSSFHNFTGTVTATVNDPNAADANAANNSMTSAISTTAILANADLAVTAGTTIERRSGAVSAAEPAGPGLRQRSDAPGECDDPDHGHEDPGQQRPERPGPGGRLSHAHQRHAAAAQRCGDLRGDADEPEPAGSEPAARPTVVNFTFDVNCSTNSFANQLAPQQIVLAFADSLATTDPHVVDPNNGNNTLAPIIYAFWNKLPFNPVYTMTIDSNTGPSEPVVIPAADNCLVNGNPFPLGAYCEMYQTTSLPAGNAIGLAITNIPQPAFSIASGHPLLGGVANGTSVAAFGLRR